MIGTILDITEEKDLQLKYIKQAQMIEQTHDSVISTDLEGNILSWNHGAERLLGYSALEAIGKHVSMLHPKEDIPDVIKSIETVMKTGEYISDVAHVTKSGETIYVSLSLSIIKDELGEIVNLVGYAQDITKRKKIENELKAVSQRMELALLGNNDGVFDLNLADNSVYYSPRWKEMLGYRDDELANEVSTWETLVHKDDIDDVWAGIQKHIGGETEYYDGVHRLKHKDGHWVWIRDRAKAIFDENGKAVRMIGTHTDITEEKELQLKYLHQAQVIEQIHDSVNITDMDGFVTSWNHASQEMFGYSADEIIGKHISMIHLKKNLSIFPDIREEFMKNGEFRIELELITKSKNLIFVSLTLSLLKDENGIPTNIVGYSQDITKRKKAEKELKKQKDILDHQAHHDALTNLPNRALFNDRLEQGIEKAKRNKKSMALLFIDLDHFKEINDSLGHAVGDEILKVTSKRLKNVIRDGDSLARLGGDEFTIILDNLAQGQDASLLAQKILKVLAQPIIIENHELYVSSSIGISLFPQDGDLAVNLLKYADSAMYKAKDNGRNNFQFYSAEMTELAFERVVMETALRSAIVNEELIVYYQPQVDATNNKLIGMEALVRWQHPTMGLVSPNKFIPLAESTGLIVEIDQYVMRTAMKQMTIWQEKGLSTGILYMNLAVKQLQQKDFIEILKNLMKETECKAQCIGLEVTEGQIMTNPQEAIIILKGISDLGIELAIDDFGTGYSSLSYLKKLPIDKLKIDQSFVRDLPDDEEDAGITNAVIALAKSLNLKIIAEGVETKEQKEFLVENGCNNIQGYLYSKPVSASEMESIILNGFL